MGRKKHTINILFAIVLFGVFALTAVFTAVLGVKVYANSAEKMQANFDTRTSLVYLSEKIRTNPEDNYSISEVDGNTALVLASEIGGVVYESWIFVRNDRLCEIMVIQGEKVLPSTAQQIMDLKSFDAVLKDGGIELSVETVGGDRNTTFLYGRTGR